MNSLSLPVILGLSEHQVQTLVNCRTLKQYASMIADYLAGKCPFCDPLDSKNRILVQHGNTPETRWRIWENPFPLKHTSLHLVMAPERHVSPNADILPTDMEAMTHLFLWAKNGYGARGGCLAMRFGPPNFNAGSVLHLHATSLFLMAQVESM